MRPDILTKLAAEFRHPIVSERQVVYIMVQLRKLIELNGDGGQYKALKFHCDWVAHPLLNGPQAQEIVRMFDCNQKLADDRTAVPAKSDMSFIAKLGPHSYDDELPKRIECLLTLAEPRSFHSGRR